MADHAIRIFLDSTPVSGPPGGIRRFTEALYRALPDVWPEASFALLTDQSEPKPQGWRRKWWSLGLPAALREKQASLFHGVDFAVPYIPVCPSVMTVHDLSPWKIPDASNARVRERCGWLLRLRVPTMIHTPSDAVRQELIDHFSWPAERVHAIPSAAAPHLVPTAERVWPKPYILSVATLEERKNLRIVIDAAQALWSEDLDFDLLLAGQSRADLPPLQAGRVFCLGFVDESKLAAYYSGALCTVYPSKYEGFGLPVLEAMQCGSPILASNIAVLQETGGAAALYADPNRVEDWVASLRRLISNSDLRAERTQLGLARARQFSWPATARAMKQLYERCLAS
jgi:glycosyltransferase involved in cell wall biosynthesis